MVTPAPKYCRTRRGAYPYAWEIGGICLLLCRAVLGYTAIMRRSKQEEHVKNRCALHPTQASKASCTGLSLPQEQYIKLSQNENEH